MTCMLDQCHTCNFVVRLWLRSCTHFISTLTGAMFVCRNLQDRGLCACSKAVGRAQEQTSDELRQTVTFYPPVLQERHHQEDCQLQTTCLPVLSRLHAVKCHQSVTALRQHVTGPCRSMSVASQVGFTRGRVYSLCVNI